MSGMEDRLTATVDNKVNFSESNTREILTEKIKMYQNSTITRLSADTTLELGEAFDNITKNIQGKVFDTRKLSM